MTIDVDAVPGLNGAAFGDHQRRQLLVMSRTMRWDASNAAPADGVPAPRTLVSGRGVRAFDYVSSTTRTTPRRRSRVVQPHRTPSAGGADLHAGAAPALTVLVGGVDRSATTDVAIDVTSTNSVGVVVERSVYCRARPRPEAGTGSSAGEGRHAVVSSARAWQRHVRHVPALLANAVTIGQVRYAALQGAVTATYTIAAGSRLIWTDLVPGLDNRIQDGRDLLNDIAVAVERAVWAAARGPSTGTPRRAVDAEYCAGGSTVAKADNAAGAGTYILIVADHRQRDCASRSFEDGTAKHPAGVPAQRRANVSVASRSAVRRPALPILVEASAAGDPARRRTIGSTRLISLARGIERVSAPLQ